MAKQTKKKKMGKKQMKKTSVRILSAAVRIFLVCFLVFALVMIVRGGYAFGKALYTEEPNSRMDIEVTVQIEEGTRTFSAAQDLSRAGVISDPFVFTCKALLFEYDIYPGTYVVNPSMTDREILDILSAGGT